MDYSQLSSNKSNETFKLTIVVGAVVAIFFLYMIVKNYKLVSSGKMQEIQARSLRNKKNKEYWDASEVG